MKIRYSLMTCLLVTSIVACFSAWVTSRTTPVTEEVSQIVLPLGVEEPFDPDALYPALLSRLKSIGISRFDASKTPLEELRAIVRLDTRKHKDETTVIVSVMGNRHRYNKKECSEILDAAIAELKKQLPDATQYSSLSRMCLN